MALRAHLVFQTFSLCVHCKTKTKKVSDFVNKFRLILKFNENRIFLEANHHSLIVPAQFICGTSHDPKKDLWMLKITKINSQEKYL